ncbi:pyridoxamine 5'-phosphate oxidase [Methylacidimicrobium cyclopophantes]|uniref:Pyridoxamine 5'-phosphate oxidase n=1 Tax=Methylacidimicrobium cyclopophantes TaxID=1041766 RepID=A0A5E6MRA1_9BACT|nr:pyridoxamine 5'-phosphate oxidase [Methylacidimicrobium cyclopophantes]VVM08377.1 pyridoxamine 5'-phosphate oxidase [Methylacidimicrobium cyclopophantes]
MIFLEGSGKEFAGPPLSLEQLDADPLRQFFTWYQEAARTEAGDPTAIALATSSREGRMRSRMVLLKAIDERGFLFFTNYRSRKGKDLEENPQAAFCCFWPVSLRQVCVRGAVEKVSTEESNAYFQSRPVLSRLSAWASPQSEPIPAERAFLENRLREMQERFAGKEVPLPPFWGGYRLVPDEIEFWQGRSNRLHDRFLYARIGDGQWKRTRLAP